MLIFLGFGASIGQDFEATRDRNDGGRALDQQVRPVAAELQHQQTSNQDAAVANGIIEAEGGGAQGELRFLQLLKKRTICPQKTSQAPPCSYLGKQTFSDKRATDCALKSIDFLSECECAASRVLATTLTANRPVSVHNSKGEVRSLMSDVELSHGIHQRHVNMPETWLHPVQAASLPTCTTGGCPHMSRKRLCPAHWTQMALTILPQL